MKKTKKLVIDTDECNIICNALLNYKDTMHAQGHDVNPVTKLMVKCYETPLRRHRGDDGELR